MSADLPACADGGDMSFLLAALYRHSVHPPSMRFRAAPQRWRAGAPIVDPLSVMKRATTKPASSMSAAEVNRLLRMTAFSEYAAQAGARGRHAIRAHVISGVPMERPRISVRVMAAGGTALAEVCITELLTPPAAAAPLSLLGSDGGARATLSVSHDGGAAVLECDVGPEQGLHVPLDPKSESLPSKDDHARDGSSADSALLLRLTGASLVCGQHKATWEPTAADGGGGSGGSDDAAAVRLALTLPPDSAAAPLRVSRTYVCSLLNDGHMLVLAVPITPTALHGAPLPHPSMQPLIDVISFFGRDANGVPSGGVFDVMSPTHALSLHELASEPFVVDDDGSGDGGCGSDGMWDGGLPGTAITGFNGEGASNEHTPHAGWFLALIEPANAGQTWAGLRRSVCFFTRTPRGMLGRWLPVGVVGALPRVDSVRVARRSGPAAPPPRPMLQLSSVPRHIAVVMDGNGRWAKSRGLPRISGHHAGVDSIHRLIRAARRLHVSYLTLYAFSAQNWSRPDDEVGGLMRLLAEFVATDCDELVANGLRLLVTGDVDRLPLGARAGLERLVRVSAGNAGLTLVLALSYGGREEIAVAAAAAARAVAAGRLPADALADPAVFRRFMPHPGLPDPDLVVRTSGEMRVSNFLLWHIAYAELYVTPALWPDFGEAQLLDALVDYARRERRFGKTSAQVAGPGVAPPHLAPRLTGDVDDPADVVTLVAALIKQAASTPPATAAAPTRYCLAAPEAGSGDALLLGRTTSALQWVASSAEAWLAGVAALWWRLSLKPAPGAAGAAGWSMARLLLLGAAVLLLLPALAMLGAQGGGQAPTAVAPHMPVRSTCSASVLLPAGCSDGNGSVDAACTAERDAACAPDADAGWVPTGERKWAQAQSLATDRGNAAASTFSLWTWAGHWKARLWRGEGDGGSSGSGGGSGGGGVGLAAAGLSPTHSTSGTGSATHGMVAASAAASGHLGGAACTGVSTVSATGGVAATVGRVSVAVPGMAPPGAPAAVAAGGVFGTDRRGAGAAAAAAADKRERG